MFNVDGHPAYASAISDLKSFRSAPARTGSRIPLVLFSHAKSRAPTAIRITPPCVSGLYGYAVVCTRLFLTLFWKGGGCRKQISFQDPNDDLGMQYAWRWRQQVRDPMKRLRCSRIAMSRPVKFRYIPIDE